MRQILTLLFCVMSFSASFLLVGCAGGDSQSQGGRENHTTHHQDANEKFTLHSEHNSGVSGTTSFVNTSDGVLVTLNLRNLPKPNTFYLAHIHPGTCAEGRRMSMVGLMARKGTAMSTAMSTAGPVASTTALR